MPYMTADQLAELLLTFVELSFLVTVAGVLAGRAMYIVVHWASVWFDKHSNPPSPVVMRALAKNMRQRADQLEAKAHYAALKR